MGRFNARYYLGTSNLYEHLALTPKSTIYARVRSVQPRPTISRTKARWLNFRVHKF